jgi:hypothetical protein
MSGFLPPDDNIATLHGTRTRELRTRTRSAPTLALTHARTLSLCRFLSLLCRSALAELWEMASTRFADVPCLGTRTTGPDGLPAGCARFRSAEAQRR